MATHTVYHSKWSDNTSGGIYSSLDDAVKSFESHGVQPQPAGDPIVDHRTGRVSIDMGRNSRIEVFELDFGDE